MSAPRPTGKSALPVRVSELISPSRPQPLGFTLIELLIVISIISILAGLLITITGKARQSRIISRAKTELGEVQAAIDNYKTKLGYYPPDNVNNTNHPGVNLLLFELAGTAHTNIGGIGYYQTLDKAVKLSDAQVTNAWQITGFHNCTRDSSEDATRAATAFLPHRREGQHFLTAVIAPPAVFNSVNDFPILGSFVEGPAMIFAANGKKINPWRYVSSNPTNNPGSYDLWIDVTVGNQTERISNWSGTPQPVASSGY